MGPGVTEPPGRATSVGFSVLSAAREAVRGARRSLRLTQSDEFLHCTIDLADRVDAADDTALAERLMTAYLRAKEAQSAITAGPYHVGGAWGSSDALRNE